MKTIIAGAALAALFVATPALAAPIEGKWTTGNGTAAVIKKCGGSFCITLASGDFKGKRIGRLSGSGNDYRGKITDPQTDKTYSGFAKLSGNSMRMRGCIVRPLCRSETWKRR